MNIKLIAVGCLHGNLKEEISTFIKSENPDAVLISGDFSGGDFADKLRNYEKNLVEKFGPIPELWPLKVQVESEKNFRKWSRMSADNSKNIFREMKKLKVPIFYIHGNWDSVTLGNRINYFESSGNFFIDDAEEKNMHFIHKKTVRLNGFDIAGFGGYRGTSGKEYLYKDIPKPWPDLDYIVALRAEIKNQMEKLFAKVSDKRKMILLTHDPPYRTFDYLKSANKFYGEKVTRDLIKKHKPLMCICSHFHEHRGAKRVGKTLVVASGYGHDGQIALINVNGSKIDVKFIG